MVLDPLPQSLPVHFFGSRPQSPTSPSIPCSQHPKPYHLTLNPGAYLLNPVAPVAPAGRRGYTSRLNPESRTLDPKSRTLTLNPKPKRISQATRINYLSKPEFCTLHPTPSTVDPTCESLHVNPTVPERRGAGVETQKNVLGEIGGWGRVPFNEPYAPSLSTIYDGA